MTHKPVRSPEREQRTAILILNELPRALRNQVVVVVSTMACGDLYATAKIGSRFLCMPQSNFSDTAFPRYAAGVFATALFASDVAASIPPKARNT
ncbi:hypothetical protein [Methyloceanibacter stevinii]|nr:hypothetical protein [Methyloceanibacter stevinii]